MPESLVTLDEVKDHLNITTATQDAELYRFLDAAVAFVERHVGPVQQREITETVTPAGGRIFLSAPVISVTSIESAYGYPGTYTVADWVISGDQLIASYGTFGGYDWPVTVTYEGGWATIPADLREATLDYIKWRWESQRGATPLPIPGGGDEFAVQPTATVPYKVMEVIDGYRLPAIA